MALELWQQVMSLLVVPLVVFSLIKPIKIRFPWFPCYSPEARRQLCCGLCPRKKRFTLKIDYAVIPLLCVFFLLACGSITWDDVYVGIVGDKNMQPYAMVILFFTLAYLCVSLDITGIFEYFAIKAMLWTNGSPMRLFAVVGLLSGVLTLVTSNDIVILTLTPIVTALGKFANINVEPYLILQFHMANLWSMAIFIGNSTNIIVAQANQIGFLEFSKWMLLPTVVCGAVAVLTIWLRFRKELPAQIPILPMVPANFLRDQKGAIFGTVCLFTCLALLLASSYLEPIKIWMITLFFMLLLLGKDVYHDIKYGPREVKGPPTMNEEESIEEEMAAEIQNSETRSRSERSRGRTPHRRRRGWDAAEEIETMEGEVEKEVTVRVEVKVGYHFDHKSYASSSESDYDAVQGSESHAHTTSEEDKDKVKEKDKSKENGEERDQKEEAEVSSAASGDVPDIRKKLVFSSRSSSSDDEVVTVKLKKLTSASSEGEESVEDSIEEKKGKEEEKEKEEKKKEAEAKKAIEEEVVVVKDADGDEKVVKDEEIINLDEKKVQRRYQVFIVAERLPWNIVPFIFSVFIVAQALKVAGWTAYAATGFAYVIGPEDSIRNATIAAFIFGLTSVLATNILNAQPMTILFSQILQEPNIALAISPRSRIGALFAVVAGSNIGANLTLVGALAGLMWAAILRAKERKISYLKFAAYGFTLVPPVLLVVCGVLSFELAVFP